MNNNYRPIKPGKHIKDMQIEPSKNLRKKNSAWRERKESMLQTQREDHCENLPNSHKAKQKTTKFEY